MIFGFDAGGPWVCCNVQFRASGFEHVLDIYLSSTSTIHGLVDISFRGLAFHEILAAGNKVGGGVAVGSVRYAASCRSQNRKEISTSLYRTKCWFFFWMVIFQAYCTHTQIFPTNQHHQLLHNLKMASFRPNNWDGYRLWKNVGGYRSAGVALVPTNKMDW